VTGIVGCFEKLSTHPCDFYACHIISSGPVTLPVLATAKEAVLRRTGSTTDSFYGAM